MPDDLPLLKETREYLILNKPAGLAVHGGKGVKSSLLDLVRKNGHARAELVHRLDRETSGVILVAKSPAKVNFINRLLADSVKQYLFVCKGSFRRSRTVITDKVGEPLRDAETRIVVKKSFGGFTLGGAELVTGRKHQIRIHLSGKEHPILGDDKYGDFPLNDEIRKKYGVKGLFLHSQRLILPGPRGKKFTYTAPPPDYFSKFLKCFNLPPVW